MCVSELLTAISWVHDHRAKLFFSSLFATESPAAPAVLISFLLLVQGLIKLILDDPKFLEDDVAEPTYEELKAQLEEMKKVAGSRRTGTLEFKVSEKGGVSVYGLGRFPVTLYYEQWRRLLEASERLSQFLEDNKSQLKLKEQG